MLRTSIAKAAAVAALTLGAATLAAATPVLAAHSAPEPTTRVVADNMIWG
ncbi:hypothetical protein [Kitasatospora sp. NBC_00458]